MANDFGSFRIGSGESRMPGAGTVGAVFGGGWFVAVLIGIAVAFAFYGVYRGSTNDATKQARPWYVPSIWLLTLFVFAAALAIGVGVMYLRSSSGSGSANGTAGFKGAGETIKKLVMSIITNQKLHVLLILAAAITLAIYIIYPAALQGKYADYIWPGPYPFKTSTVIAADHEMPRSNSSVEYTHSCFVFIDPTNSVADVPRPITVMERASMWRLESIPSRGQLKLVVNSGVAGGAVSSTIVDNVPIQRYVHLALVVKNIDVRLFMDGRLVAGLTTGSLPALNNSPLATGTASGARDAGSIRSVGYWSRALSASEIQTAYSRALMDLGTPAPGPYGDNSNVFSSMAGFKTRICIGDYCT